MSVHQCSFSKSSKKNYRKISKMNYTGSISKPAGNYDPLSGGPGALSQPCFSGRACWLPAWCTKRPHGQSSPADFLRFKRVVPTALLPYPSFLSPGALACGQAPEPQSPCGSENSAQVWSQKAGQIPMGLGHHYSLTFVLCSQN